MIRHCSDSASGCRGSPKYRLDLQLSSCCLVFPPTHPCLVRVLKEKDCRPLPDLMRVHLIIGALLLGASLPAAFGASVDQIVAFGDSLSDTGNLSISTFGQFPGDNYAEGRFTNGPDTTPATSGPFGLWVEQLAGRLGVPAPEPSLGLTGGSDYA